MNNAEPAWVAADQPAAPDPSPPNRERVSNPAATIKEENGEAWLFEFNFCLRLSPGRLRPPCGEMCRLLSAQGNSLHRS